MKDIYDHGYSVSTENFSEGPTVTDSNLTMSCDSSLVYICEAYIQPILLAIGILTNAASLVILPRTRIVPTFKICLNCIGNLGSLCYHYRLHTDAGRGYSLWWRCTFRLLGRARCGHYSLYFLFILFMCASAGLVILIVAIRSAMVSRPLSARRFLTNGRTGKLCLCVLIVTTLLFAPTTLNILWQSCYHDTETQFCIDLLDVFPYLENVSNSYLYVITVIYGPLLVLIYIGCFIGIKISLNKTQKMIRELSQRKSTVEPGGKVKNKMSKTAKSTRTLLVIIVLDTCCTLPQVIQGVGLHIFSHNNNIWQWYMLVRYIWCICGDLPLSATNLQFLALLF